jgi:ABC-type sugar transport system ATPase subunit
MVLARKAEGMSGKATLGIRPEHFTVDGTGDLFVESKVSVVEHLGDQCMLYMELDGMDGPLVAVADGDFMAQKGDVLKLGIPASRAHLFDQNQQRVLPLGE